MKPQSAQREFRFSPLAGLLVEPVKQLTAISLRLTGNNYKVQVMNYKCLNIGTKFSAVCSFFLSTDNYKLLAEKKAVDRGLLTIFHVSWILFLLRV